MGSTFNEPDRADLLAALDHQRASVRSIVHGLSEEAWHTSVVPSGWTPAGLVVDLGGAERHWTCGVILDHDPGHPFDDDFDEDQPYDPNALSSSTGPSANVRAYYEDQARQTEEMLAVTALGSAPRGFTEVQTRSSRGPCAQSFFT
jgi:hypothetical protein